MIWRKTSLLSFIICLFMVFALPVMAQERLQQGVWSVVEEDGKPIGYGYDQRWKIEDGFRYVSEGALQMSVLEGAPTRINFYMELIVDDNYLAKSFQFAMESSNSRSLIKGTFSGNQIEMVQTLNDRDAKSQWTVESPLYFEESFVDYLFANEKLKDGKEFEAKIFDFKSLSPGSYEFTVSGPENYSYGGKEIPVYVLTEKVKPDAKRLIGVDGTFYWSYEPMLNLTTRRVNEDEIPELQTMAADVLMVPGNIKVLHPFRSEKSTVRVRWKDVDFDRFNFNDNRQSLVELIAGGEWPEVVIEVARDNRDFTGVVTLPVTDEVFAEDLGDGQYIIASLPEIKRLVREVLADERDGWEATKKLVEWTNRTIEPTYSIDTLGTEQILQSKQGKCMEYSILFAAMARAAGLPTRVAVGERYQNNMWVGHMWNEVWLGEWVAVDASHNQVSPDALLLKFVDSSTVLGTLTLRRGLTGKLGIEIEDVELAQVANNQDELETGIVGQTYTNADFMCQFTVPEGWMMTQREQQGSPMLIAASYEQTASAILFMLSVPPGIASEQMLNHFQTGIMNELPICEIIDEEIVEFGKDSAAVGTMIFERGLILQQQNLVIIRDDRCFFLMLTAPKDEWDEMESVFAKILEDFMIM